MSADDSTFVILFCNPCDRFLQEVRESSAIHHDALEDLS
jgi:hypothetical protein